MVFASKWRGASASRLCFPHEPLPSHKDQPYRYYLQIAPNTTALEQRKNVDGVFPLVTNLDTHQYGAAEVLSIYKYQPYVEKKFALLKSEQCVCPLFEETAPGRCHAPRLLHCIGPCLPYRANTQCGNDAAGHRPHGASARTALHQKSHLPTRSRSLH